MKQKTLDSLLNQRLSKTPEQDRRENASVASILKRFNDAEVLPETTDAQKEDSLIPSLKASGSNITRSEIDRPEFTRPIINRPITDRPKIDIRSEQNKGFLAVPHVFIDQILPGLSTTEQVVLLRLFRLSRGFGKETCEVGQGALQKACNITRNTLKTTITSLIHRGYIDRLEMGSGPESSVYKVNIAGVSKFDRHKTDRSEFDRSDVDSRSDSGRAMPDETLSISDPGGGSNNGPITNMDSSINKQHTQTQIGVGVASRFTLEECRRYADNLKQTGQGIKNPGGYATKIFRSGEADALIDAFLNPPVKIDPNECPDCGGSNFIYLDPSNRDKGVKPCKHEKLKQ